MTAIPGAYLRAAPAWGARGLLVASLLAATAPSAGADERTPAELKLEASMTLQKAKRYDDALAALREASAAKPGDSLAAEIAFRKGENHYLKARDASEERLPQVDPQPSYRQAIQAFRDMLERYPDQELAAESAYLLASSHFFLDEIEKALAAYQNVYDRYPRFKNRSLCLFRVAICREDLGQMDEARAAFKKLIREFPGAPELQKARRHLQEMAFVGQPAPPLSTSQWLQGLVGPEGLKSFDGQVVVLVFFATWCDNCKRELPHLRSVMRRLQKSDVVFLGVANPEDKRNPITVDAYVPQNRLEFFDVALDRGNGSSPAYGVSAFPAAVVIDRKGTIRWRGHPAFFPRPLVDKLLEEKG